MCSNGILTAHASLRRNLIFDICRALGAKWVTSDEKTGIVELWKEKPTKNSSNGAYYGNNGIRRVACINSEIMISVKPGDCISVEELL